MKYLISTIILLSMFTCLYTHFHVVYIQSGNVVFKSYCIIPDKES